MPKLKPSTARQINKNKFKKKKRFSDQDHQPSGGPINGLSKELCWEPESLANSCSGTSGKLPLCEIPISLYKQHIGTRLLQKFFPPLRSSLVIPALHKIPDFGWKLLLLLKEHPLNHQPLPQLESQAPASLPTTAMGASHDAEPSYPSGLHHLNIHSRLCLALYLLCVARKST